jgi:hypothetical protein
MVNAEKHGILHKAQFGSRQGKMAISTVLLKQLSYDIIWQTRVDACMFDIIPSIAMIKNHCTGMSCTATNVLLALLLCIEYHVCTAYGVSTKAYSNMIDWLLDIVMQGARHSGTLWALTSSVILDQMDATHGTDFHSAHPHRLCHRTTKAFVDDTTLWLLKLGLLLVATIANHAELRPTMGMTPTRHWWCSQSRQMLLVRHRVAIYTNGRTQHGAHH